MNLNLTHLQSYSTAIVVIINSYIVPVLFAVAFLYFLWGVYKYFIYGADNESEREKGKQFVLWGIIGFVVILSVWGLVNMVMSTLGLESGGGSPPPPTFDTSNTPTVHGTVSSWIVQP
ncbi:MAG: Mbov_0395 family pilin-like conjugal transfer protein [Minisyncoccota bacterium]